MFIFTLKSLCFTLSTKMRGETSGKTVYLIRHAESENNVSKRAYKESLGKLRPPSWTQIGAMAQMVTLPMNTPLSERGVRQVTGILFLLCKICVVKFFYRHCQKSRP